jgi:hypothetical protein
MVRCRSIAPMGTTTARPLVGVRRSHAKRAAVAPCRFGPQCSGPGSTHGADVTPFVSVMARAKFRSYIITKWKMQRNRPKHNSLKHVCRVAGKFDSLSRCIYMRLENKHSVNFQIYHYIILILVEFLIQNCENAMCFVKFQLAPRPRTSFLVVNPY